MALLMGVTALTGAYVAAYQTWLQRFAKGVSCAADQPWWERFVDWAGAQWPLLFEASGFCSEAGWKLFGLVDCRVVADRLYGIHLRRPGDVLAQKLTASPSRERRLFHTGEKWPEQRTLPLPGQPTSAFTARPYSIAAVDLAFSRNRNFWILPVEVLTSGSNTNRLGTL